MLTFMPVSSLKGCRFAAMADVGAVFSEMKLSVIPENCFHMPPSPTDPCVLDPPPQPTIPRRVVPAKLAPVSLRKSRLLNSFETLTPLPPTFLSPRIAIVLFSMPAKNRHNERPQYFR